MKYIVYCFLLLIPLYQLPGVDVEPVGRGEARNEYRDGYRYGVIAGEQEGQQLWQVLGCISGSAGSFLGCYSLAITSGCGGAEYDECGFPYWESGSCSPYLLVGLSGFAGGMLTGGSIALMAGSSGDSPSMLIGHSPEYTQGYIDGFRYTTKKKKGEAALTGALIGTLSSTVLMLIWIDAVITNN